MIEWIFLHIYSKQCEKWHKQTNDVGHFVSEEETPFDSYRKHTMNGIFLFREKENILYFNTLI